MTWMAVSRLVHRRHIAVAAVCLATAAATLSLLGIVRPETQQPGAVTVRVTGCDFGLSNAAQMSYSVTNGDGEPHSYRVEMTVTAGSRIVGHGESLVNHVAAGATANARALVQVTSAVDASCSVHASVFDGPIGHHA